MCNFLLTPTVGVSWRKSAAKARGRWLSLTIVLTAAVTLTGCATTKAATVAEGPPLAVPQAPERVLIPADEEPLASTPTGPATPLAVVPQVQPPPPQQRRSNAPRADNDGRNEQSAPAAASSTANVETPRESRPIPAAESAGDQQRVRDLLAKASNDLKCVDFGKLSNDRKVIYNESKRHAETATEKMKERNFIVALPAAEKAASFAADVASTCANR